MSKVIFNFDEIDPEQLTLYSSKDNHSAYITMHYYLYDHKEITDEILSWLLNPPPPNVPWKIREIDEMKTRILADEKAYIESHEFTLHVTRLVKKEFFKLLHSYVYKNEINTNDVIKSISIAIADEIDNVIEIEKIMSLVTFLMLILKNESEYKR